MHYSKSGTKQFNKSNCNSLQEQSVVGASAADIRQVSSSSVRNKVHYMGHKENQPGHDSCSLGPAHHT